jgi:tripartite-type tricarboxylate transporter receptor subunit TctC
MKNVFAKTAIALALTSTVLFASAQAQDAASFYKGKTINVVIGFSPGGGYDLYARVVAKYLGKHIPGEPTLVAQNMPGAGSLRAAMYLFSVAPKDGTAIGIFSRGMPLSPLFELPGAHFDATKFTWLGSVTKDTVTCISWKTSPVKKWDDLFKSEYKAGGEGKGADPDVYATLIKTTFGANVKLITGYPGSSNISLAMERGELDGMCGISYSTLRSTHPDWLKNHDINLLVQGALEKDPEMANVPFMLDLAKSDEQKQMLRLTLAPQAMARPFVAPPGMPADRAKALQKAFDDTMKDPEFLAEAKRLNLDVNPMSGQQVLDLLTGLYATPKPLVQQAKAALGY